MTGSTMPSAEGWDDTRLDAAFLERNRATPPTPPDLVDTVRDRIAASPRADRASLAWRLAPALGLAATVVLAVVVGVGQLGLVGPVASARPTTPTASVLVGSPLNLPQAIAFRDGGVDDREIAVTGFLGSSSMPRFCPAIRIPANPTRLDCSAGSTWLMEDRESVETTSGGTITLHGPKGPAIQPSYQLVSLPPVGVYESSPPAWPAVTVVGHFDDRRSNLCESGAVTACRDTFVVDRIAAVGALEQPVTTRLANTRYDEATTSDVALTPTTTEAAVDRAIVAAAPEVAILSRQLLTGDRLGSAEPGLRDDAAWTDQRLVWIVTAVGLRDGRPVARTFLLPDGTTALVEMTANGPIAIASTVAMGLPTLSVAEAIAVRDGDPSDREIAVRGWFSSAQTLPCPAPPRSVNPVRLQCPFTTQWLLDTPKLLGAGQGFPESGRAGFQALLPFLDLTALTEAAKPATTEERLPEVVLVGHFHDRRGHGALCDVPDPAACAGFIADGIYSIDGVRTTSSTTLDMEPWEPELRHEPTWTPDDVDRLLNAALPGFQTLSRVALPGHRISQIEPALGTGALGIIDRDVVWSVTGLDAGTGGVPVRRTFLLVDGTAEAYEAVPWSQSVTGFAAINLRPPQESPAATEPPVTPSPNPTLSASADFPTSWLGLPVVGVADVIARQTPDLIDDTAMFVRGWYIAPDPTDQCPALEDDRGPIEQPCPAGQHWLLEQPERLWTDPGAPWIHRRPTGPAINPIVLPDVPFDIPNLWFDTGPSPLPVVLLGHLGDTRSGYYPGVAQFVVDALVWRAGDPASTRPWLMAPSVEDATSVMARVDRDVGPALGTWLSVVSGAELAALHTDSAPELRDAPAVWIARSLLVEDGRPRVHPILTADEGRRVWSGMTLLTTIDLQIGDGVTLEISDGPDEIVAARTGLPEGAAEWVNGNGPPETGEVMLGVIKERPNELRVAWVGRDCDRTWRLGWGAGEVLLWPRDRLGECPPSTRLEVVLTFDHPVDLEAISVSNGGAGG